MSPEKVLKKMEYAIGKHFHSENIKFSSFAMASFIVLRDLFAHHKDFLLVDICGEITDISLVKDDILCDSISFPLGRNFVTRKIARLFNCPLDEAKMLVSLYKDRHIEKMIGKKLEPAMDKIESEWLKNFQKSLSGLAGGVFIPSTIFLTADQNISGFFSEIIKNGKFKFLIIPLSTKELHKTALFGEDTVRDPFITIESVYINRFFN
jgi:hypothetical protein